MKVALLITGSGPLGDRNVSDASFIDPPLIEKLRVKGIEKFIAYEVPLATAQQRYGRDFPKFHERSPTYPMIFAFSISTVSEHFAFFG